MHILLTIVAVIIGWKLLVFLIRRHKNKVRRKYLLEKYGDEKIVEDIMNSLFWQGQTEDQLYDSLGQPYDIDKKVLKSKIKETWKYQQVRKGQFALRITVENGVVIGWDKKS